MAKHLKGKHFALVAMCVAALWIACLTALSASAALTSLTVEQLRAQSPQIRVYCYDNTEALTQSFSVEGYLDGGALTYTGLAEATEYGTAYTVLLDVSGSIRAPYLEAEKEQIIRLADGLGEHDALTLITFGDEVATLLTETTDAQAVREALQDVQSRDQTTHLYEAICDGIALSEAAGDTGRRRVMLVISDGIQDTGSSGMTVQEVTAALDKEAIPVYAFCVDYADAASRTEFGSFARATGGEYREFDSGDAAPWDAFRSRMAQCRVLCFEADVNHADGAEHTLLTVFTVGEASESYANTVRLTGWQKDDIAPTVQSAKYEAETGAITVLFSEAVSGAQIPENYLVTQDGKEYSIGSVSVQSGAQYLVYLAEALPNGEYTLTLSNIRDDSMEANALEAAEIHFTVEGVVAKGASGVPLWLWGGIAAAVAAVVAAVVSILAARKRRLAAPSPAAAPVVSEQKVEYVVRHVPAGEKPEKIQIPGGAKDGADNGTNGSGDTAVLQVLSIGADRVPRTFEIPIQQSSIWGRSPQNCDVSFDDKRMTRQHCVVEAENNALYLSDLQSKNGVYCNGVRIGARQRLQVGDQLQIGDSSIRILAIRF